MSDRSIHTVPAVKVGTLLGGGPVAESFVCSECGNPELRRTMELRCPPGCGCGAKKGRLIATLVDVPEVLFGSGAVLQMVCPGNKSAIIRITF